MRICQGCGGILGRDCFNELECIWISQSQQQQPDYQEPIDNTDYEELHRLTNEIDAKNGIISDVFDTIDLVEKTASIASEKAKIHETRDGEVYRVGFEDGVKYALNKLKEVKQKHTAVATPTSAPCMP